MENELNPNILSDWFNIALLNKRIYVMTNHVSCTNMGAYYSLFVVHEGQLWRAWPNQREENGDWSYNEKLGKDLGFRNNKKYQSWYRGGCGYDRAHDIVYSFARHFGYDLKDINKISIESLQIVVDV